MPREFLGAHVGVKTVGQRIADGFHMAARAARRLQNGDLVAAFHQFVGAGQAGDAAAGDDDLFRAARRGERL